MLTGSAALLVLIPNSYLKPDAVAETGKKKKKCPGIPSKNCLTEKAIKALFSRGFPSSVTTEFLVNGSYTDPNCSSSCTCIMSNLTLKKVDLKLKKQKPVSENLLINRF